MERKKLETNVFDRKSFREALLTKRIIEKNISLREAAVEIGISSATLSRCENSKDPDIHTLFYCCKWLGIEMGKFFIK